MTPSELANLIRDRHWRQKHSIRRIERDLGFGTGTLGKILQRHNIGIRSRKEQIAITNRDPEIVAKRSGERHWAYGKRKETDEWARKHSERMKRSNPAANPKIMAEMAKSMADAWREKPTKAEAEMIAVLANSGAAFCFEKAIGTYIVDFAFPLDWVILEIDSSKRGRDRKNDHLIRDRWLVSQGWIVVRALNEHAFRPWHLLAVLEKLVPSVNRVSPRPSGARQYRVLVRSQKNPAGVKV